MKRLLSLLLALIMLAQMLPLTMFAADNTSTAASTRAAGKTPNGDGSKNTPYIIQTPEHLVWVSEQSAAGNTFSSKYIELAANINLSGYTWNPIQDFKGTFDGNKYNISNLTVTNASVTPKDSNGAIHLGLFGINNGTVKNVTVINANIENTTSGINYVRAGVIAGDNNGTIESCLAEGKINITSGKTDVAVGGVVGYAGSNSAISKTRCTTAVNVDVSVTAYVGGICGCNNSKISECVQGSTVKVSGDGGYKYAGGIAGLVTSTGTVSDSYYSGSEVSANTNGTAVAGGIAGQLEGTIQNCYVPGTLVRAVSQNAYAAGIAGFTQNKDGKTATVKKCVSAVSSIDAHLKDTSSAGGAYSGSIVQFQSSQGSPSVSGCYYASDTKYTSQKVDIENTCDGPKPNKTSPANYVGSGVTQTDVSNMRNTTSFFTTTLGWSSSVWSHTKGSLPTLKCEGYGYFVVNKMKNSRGALNAFAVFDVDCITVTSSGTKSYSPTSVTGYTPRSDGESSNEVTSITYTGSQKTELRYYLNKYKFIIIDHKGVKGATDDEFGRREEWLYHGDSPVFEALTGIVGYDRPASQTKTNITAGGTIDFYYPHKSYKVTVEYWKDGATSSFKSSQKDVNFESDFALTSPTLDEYKAYKVVPQKYGTADYNVKGTVDEELVTPIKVYYTPKLYNITVKRVDENGNDIVAPVKDTILATSKYEFTPNPSDIKHYTFNRATVGNVEISADTKITKDNTVITYYYTQNKARLRVNYVYADGSTAFETYVSPELIPCGSNFPGGNPAPLDGYMLSPAASLEAVLGPTFCACKAKDGYVDVTFTYSDVTSPLSLVFYDEYSGKTVVENYERIYVYNQEVELDLFDILNGANVHPDYSAVGYSTEYYDITYREIVGGTESSNAVESDVLYVEKMPQNHDGLKYAVYIERARKNSGSFANGIEWVLYADGTLEFEGDGDVPDFAKGSAPWHNERKYITNVTTKGDSEIARLGNYALYDCDNVTNTDWLADASFSELGDYVFSGCDNLKSVNISSKIEEVGIRFVDATVTDITVDSDNKFFSVKEGVLFDADKTEIVLCFGEYYYSFNANYYPYSSVTKVRDYAFYQKPISEIVLSEKITYVGDHAFEDVEITNIAIPGTLEYLGEYAFTSDKLKTAHFGAGVPENTKTDYPGNVFGESDVTVYYPDSLQEWFDSVNSEIVDGKKIYSWHEYPAYGRSAAMSLYGEYNPYSLKFIVENVNAPNGFDINDVALKNVKVTVDGTAYYTDEDGFVSFTVAPGTKAVRLKIEAEGYHCVYGGESVYDLKDIGIEYVVMTSDDEIAGTRCNGDSITDVADKAIINTLYDGESVITVQGSSEFEIKEMLLVQGNVILARGLPQAAEETVPEDESEEIETMSAGGIAGGGAGGGGIHMRDDEEEGDEKEKFEVTEARILDDGKCTFLVKNGAFTYSYKDESEEIDIMSAGGGAGGGGGGAWGDKEETSASDPIYVYMRTYDEANDVENITKTKLNIALIAVDVSPIKLQAELFDSLSKAFGGGSFPLGDVLPVFENLNASIKFKGLDEDAAKLIPKIEVDNNLIYVTFNMAECEVDPVKEAQEYKKQAYLNYVNELEDEYTDNLLLRFSEEEVEKIWYHCKHELKPNESPALYLQEKKGLHTEWTGWYTEADFMNNSVSKIKKFEEALKEGVEQKEVALKKKSKVTKSPHFQFDAELGGGMVFEIDENGVSIKPMLQVGLELKMGYDFDFVVAFIPLTVGISAGGKATGTIYGNSLEFSVVKDGIDVDFEFDPEFLLELEAWLKVNAGIGFSDFMSAGIYGKAGIKTSLKFGRYSYFNGLYVTGELGAYFKLKLGSHITLADETYPFVKGEYPLIESRDMFALSSYEPLVSILSVDDGTEWKTDGSTEVLDDAYPFAAPQLAYAGDTLIAVYLDIDETQNDYNTPTLMYSVYDETTDAWSLGMPVDGNNQVDSDFDVISTDDKVYVAYTEANKSFADDYESENLLLEMSVAQEIVVAEFDGTAFSNHKVITADNYQDSLPTLGIIDNNVVVVWNKNTGSGDDAVFGMNYQNSIYFSSYTDGNWSNSQCIQGSMGVVSDIAVGELGNSTIAIMTDSDNSLSTVGDHGMYIFDLDSDDVKYIDLYEKSVGAMQSAEFADKNILMWAEDGNIAYITDFGKVEYLFEEKIEDLGQQYKLVKVPNGKYAFLWSVQGNEQEVEGEKYAYSTIFAKYYDENGWGKTLRFTDTSYDQSSFDAFVTDENIELIFSSLKVDRNAETLSMYSKIGHSQLVPNHMLTEFIYISCTQNIDGTAYVSLGFNNNGASAIEQIGLYVRCLNFDGTYSFIPRGLYTVDAQPYEFCSFYESITGILVHNYEKCELVAEPFNGTNKEFEALVAMYEATQNTVGNYYGSGSNDVVMEEATYSFIVGAPEDNWANIGGIGGVGIIGGKDEPANLVVEGEYIIILDKEYLSLKVANEEYSQDVYKFAARDALLKVTKSNGEVFYEETIPLIDSHEIKYYLIKIDKDYADLTDEVFTCTITCDTEEDSTMGDNTCEVVAYKPANVGEKEYDYNELVEISELSSYNETFDKNTLSEEYNDIEVDVILNGNTYTGAIIDGIEEENGAHGSVVNVSTDDNGDTKAVIHKEYLMTLDEGAFQVTMLFKTPTQTEGTSGHIPAVLTVNIIDTTPIELTGEAVIVGGTSAGSIVHLDVSKLAHLFNAKYEWYVDGECVSTESTYTPAEEQIGCLLEGKLVLNGLFKDTHTYTATIKDTSTHSIEFFDLAAYLTYKWYLDDELVSETASYHIEKSDAGKNLRVEISGTDRYVGTLVSESITIDKNKRQIAKPTVLSEDEAHNITLNRIVSVGDGEVYYGSAYTDDIEAVTDWQTSRTFAPPAQSTVYYFAKVDETDSYATAESDSTLYEYTGPTFIPGDVNGDKRINTRDIIALSRYYTDGCITDPNGYNVSINELAADVNDDGRINTRDIIALSRYYTDGCKTDPDGYNVTLLRSKGINK